MGFNKLKRSFAHKKHHPSSPGAVAAVIGREKYGEENFKKMAQRGKKHCYGEDIDAIAELMALSEGLVNLRDTVLKGIKS